MRTSIALVVALAAGLTSCTSGSDDPATDGSPAEAAVTSTPTQFAGTECPADVSAVVVGEVACGFLTVPEDRSAAAGEARIFVAQIKPPQILHDDPMLVAGTDLANLPNYGGIAPLAQRVGREVILMDARGVGHSEPSLACPEVDDIQADVLSTATHDEATRATFLDAVAACHRRLVSDGVDPAAYNLSEMAADAETLRTALGIDEWNVVTYGTASRIALEMLRQDAGSVRSVLLDSPELPGTDPRTMGVDGTRAALSAVLDACAADRRCATAYPAADALLDTALGSLAAEPVTLSMTAAGEQPAEVHVDDALLLRLLRGMLSDGGSSGSFMLAASVPALLTSAAADRLDGLASTFATVVAGSPPYCLGYLPKCLPQHRASLGTALSVLCHDIAPFHDGLSSTRAAADGAPGYATAYADSPYLDACDAWPVGDGAPEQVDTPIASDVPVLAMVGAFSPYSPASVVRDGLTGMPRSTLVVDPAGGHNVMGSDCLVAIRSAWLDDLELTTDEQDCLADQSIDWVTDPATFQAPASATAPSTPSTTSAGNRSLEGVWEADLSRGEIARALTEGGFSGLAQRFFVSEEIPDDGIRTRSTFRDGQFTQAYRGPDGTWQVGWEADLDTAGDRVEVIDEATAGTDTLRWRVEDGRVRFIPVETTSPMYKGIPQMAYLWAYFAADSHRRVE